MSNLEKEHNDINYLKEENGKLVKELAHLKLFFSELEETNNHLVSATWRERDMKKKLADTIEELNKTKLIVETQNKRITESINYARKIQIAINTTEGDLLKRFPDSFCFYLPKDVISGDFPWMFELDDYLYVAAVDCTGHGVPGAMMSMIGNLLLNDIANDGKVLLPSEVLNKLHKAVVQTLKQDFSDSNSNDGMDVGLCRINKISREVCFSGAHRPLFFLRNSQIEIFTGDKFPIGGVHYKGLNKFTDHIIKFQEGDALFVFTDGLPDQIGGPEGKKLMTKSIKTFLENNSHMMMSDIKTRLAELLTEWKGNRKQIDDILTIGIRF